MMYGSATQNVFIDIVYNIDLKVSQKGGGGGGGGGGSCISSGPLKLLQPNVVCCASAWPMC